MKNHLVVCLNPTLQRTLTFPAVTPGQVNRAASHREDASGKGVNVTRILTELGEQAEHLTQFGGESGRLFLALCKADGIAVRAVHAQVGVRTCYTLLDQAEHQTTELVEPGYPVGHSVEQELRQVYSQALGSAHTVIISGSKAPGFSDLLYPELVAEARAAGVRVILDIRGNDLIRSLEHCPQLVKINVSEFAATFLNESLPEGSSVPTAVTDQMTALAREGTQVVLTNGRQPALVTERGGVLEVPVESVKPVNTIGCGDAVTAGISAGISRGMELRDALALGLDCARRNAVQVKPGTLG